MEVSEIIMYSLFSGSTQIGLVRTAYSLNREANQIAQTDPVRAAELRQQVYADYFVAQPVFGKKQNTGKPAFSTFALNSKANRIAQAKPELAIQLRMKAAYA